MKIENSPSRTSFKRLIVSEQAEKLLKRGNKLIKEAEGEFLTTYIPEGHKKPLWSIIKENLLKSQEQNKNNIIVDVESEGKKKLLSITTVDAQGFPFSIKKTNPFIKTGTKSELFTAEELYYDANSLKDAYTRKQYIKTDFFDALKTAEIEVNELHQKDLNLIEKVGKKLQEISGKQNSTKRNAVKKSSNKGRLDPEVMQEIQAKAKEVKDKLRIEKEISRIAGKLEKSSNNHIPRREKKRMKKENNIK